MKFFIAASLLALASAKCDENCNGNGLCAASDKCSCFQGWQGVSCSERVCAFGNAWIGDHATYVECSNKGTCDRKSGLCKCQDGFSGSSCQRMNCPGEGNCNNHGKCRPQSMIYTGGNTWDDSHIQGCICDPGYEGNSCEMRMCPRGDDALTVGSGDVQTQRITISHGTAISGEFTISFTAANGETYTTWAFTASTVTASAIEEALEALPNQVVPDCSVADNGALSATSRSFDVSFTHSSNSGNQNQLVVNSAACNDAGCHIVHVGLTSGGTTSTVVIQGTADADYENAVCSGRGTCNSETGECGCVEGYRGQACEIQSIFT